MFGKKLISLNLEKHNSTPLIYQKFQIYNIMCNANTHLVSLFKDYLLYDDTSEFVKYIYKFPKLILNLKELISYYESFCYLFPNYTAIPEGKFIYDNITNKQILIDYIEEQEDKINNKINRNGISNSDIFDTKIYNNIIAETGNNSKIKDLFSISPKKDENEKNKQNDSIKNLIEIIENTEKYKPKKIFNNCLINKTFLNIKKLKNVKNYVMSSKRSDKINISSKLYNNNSTNYKSSSPNSNVNKSISSNNKTTKFSINNLFSIKNILVKKKDKNKLCIDILNNNKLKFTNLNLRINSKFLTKPNTSRAKSKSILNIDDQHEHLKTESSYNSKNINRKNFLGKINKTHSINFLLLKKMTTARNKQHSFAFQNQITNSNLKCNLKYLSATSNNIVIKHSKVKSIPLNEISNLLHRISTSKTKKKTSSTNKNSKEKIINKNNILKLVNKNGKKYVIHKNKHFKDVQSLNLNKMISSIPNKSCLTYRNNRQNKNKFSDNISISNNNKKKKLTLGNLLKIKSKDK